MMTLCDEAGQVRAMKMTPRRAELLRFIIREQQSKGRPPTRREMCSHLGLSINAVCELVDKLQRHGFIERKDGSPRALVVLRWADGVPYDLTRGRADELRADLPEAAAVEVAATGYAAKIELVRVL